MTEDRYLSPEEESVLLRIARDSLESYVRSGRRLAVEQYPLTDRLREKHGAFVTLRRGHELRGCIGYTRSMEPLCETVRDNAINAGARDPRFPPVAPDELPNIRIEVSALLPGDAPGSPFIAVSDIQDIEIGRDGLYLEHAGPRGGGLLLPQVAIENGWDVGSFLEALCIKAGAPHLAWESPDARLYRFGAQVFAEQEH